MHPVALQPVSSPQAVKIVIADDDVLVRLELAEALRGDRFQVFEAANLSEAIAILKSTPDIDVVVSDMSMRTAQDGLELALYVRRHHPGASVVLSSGNRQPVGTSSVFDGFFAKPYCARELADWIRLHLGHVDQTKLR